MKDRPPDIALFLCVWEWDLRHALIYRKSDIYSFIVPIKFNDFPLKSCVTPCDTIRRI